MAGGSGRCAGSCPTCTSAPSARSASTAADSRASEPVTRSPLASRMRAIPLIPAPPMPMKWTVTPPSPPVFSAHRPCASRPRRATTCGQRVRPAARRAGAAGRRAHRRQPGRVGEQRQQLGEHPFAGQLGVGHQHAAARGDDGRGVERLLAVAVRQRDVDGGQPDGRHLRDGHRPAPAEHRVRGGVGQVHRVDVGQPDVARGLPGDGAPALPWACSTAIPAAASSGRAAASAVLSVRAPCEPPKTSSTGAVGGQAELLPAPRPAAPAGPAR